MIAPLVKVAPASAGHVKQGLGEIGWNVMSNSPAAAQPPTVQVLLHTMPRVASYKYGAGAVAYHATCTV